MVMKQLYQYLCSILLLTLFIKYNCFAQESQLRLGKAVNVFIRFGYLSISMKVISYNDTEKWLFKEPTNNIFQVSCVRATRIAYKIVDFIKFPVKSEQRNLELRKLSTLTTNSYVCH